MCVPSVPNQRPTSVQQAWVKFAATGFGRDILSSPLSDYCQLRLVKLRVLLDCKIFGCLFGVFGGDDVFVLKKAVCVPRFVNFTSSSWLNI